MTWFSLPAIRAEKPPAFADMQTCNGWLATQPLANAPLMQGELAEQLERLNGCGIAPRERFKVLETLRKAVFAIENRKYQTLRVPAATSLSRRTEIA